MTENSTNYSPNDNDLLCCENPSADLDEKCDPLYDSVFLRDPRVLDNMLHMEEKYMPSSSYLTVVQTEINPCTRETVANWMYDVSFIFKFI